MITKLTNLLSLGVRLPVRPVVAARLQSGVAAVHEVVLPMFEQKRVPYYRKRELSGKLTFEQFKVKEGFRTLEEFKTSESIKHLYKGDSKAIEAAYKNEMAFFEGAYRDYLEGLTPSRLL